MSRHDYRLDCFRKSIILALRPRLAPLITDNFMLLPLPADKSGKSNLRLRPVKICRPAVCEAR